MSKIFILNVDEKHENYGLDAEYVNIVDLKNFDFKVLPEWIDKKRKRKISISEINIALTHHTIWKKIVDNKIKTALILENDSIVLTEKFNEIYSNMNDLVFEYDLLYLGRKSLNSGNEVLINSLFVKPLHSHGSYAYILTYNGALKLINSKFLDNLLPVDEFLSIMHDTKYPYKLYSIFFNDFEKLYAFALKTNIVNKIKRKKLNNRLSYLDLITKNTTIYYEKTHKNLQSELVNNWILRSSNFSINCLLNINMSNIIMNKFLLRKPNNVTQ